MQAGDLDLVGQPFAAVQIAVHRPAARLEPWQYRPADRGGDQRGADDQQRAGRQRVERVLQHLEQLAVGLDRVLLDPGLDLVDQHEGGKDGQEEQHRGQRGAEREEQRFAGPSPARHVRTWPALLRRPSPLPLRRRAVPDFAFADAAASCQCCQPFEPAEVGDRAVAFHHGVGADIGLTTDLDGADHQLAALDAHVLEVDVGADAGAVGDAQQMRLPDRHRADHDILADLRAHRAQVAVVERAARQQVGRCDLVQPVGQPPTEIVAAPERVAPSPEPVQQQPAAEHGNAQAQQMAGQEHQHRGQHRERDAVAGLAGVVVVGEEGRQPVHDVQRDQRWQHQGLRQAAEPAARAWRDREGRWRCRGGDRPAGLHRRGNRRDPALAVDIVDRHLGEARVLAQRRDQARRQQRMAAEVVEEVRMAAQRQAREKACQRGEQRGFSLGLGQVGFGLVGGRHRTHRQRAQGLAVDLARGQARDRLDQLETARHHIGRQRLAQLRAQRHDLDRLAVARNDVGHELLDAVDRLEHHRGGTVGQLPVQRGLNLAELDPKAAHLDLIIGPAQAVDLPLRIDAREVAGAIEARFAFMFRPRVGQELLGGQLGAAQIALGDAGTDDAELAGLAGRQQPHLGVDHQQAVVGQWLADRDRIARLQLGQAGRYGGFGRPVAVEQAARRRGPALDQRRRADFAAEVDQAQAGHVGAEQRQQGRHRVQHGDAVGRQRARQRVGVGGDLARSDPERGADQVGNPDFLERHVEGDRKALVDPVVGAHAEPLVFAAQEMADRALADRHPLGLAGRARGVDHIGRLLRAGAAAPQQRIGMLLLQIGLVPDLTGDRVELMLQAMPGHDAEGLRVFQADLHPLGWRLGVEGQPGGAGLGDRELAHQQVDAARQPEAEDLARSHALGDQVMRHQVGAGVELAVAQAQRAADQGGLLGLSGRAGLEQIGEQFVAQQLGTGGAPQNHRETISVNEGTPGRQQPGGLALRRSGLERRFCCSFCRGAPSVSGCQFGCRRCPGRIQVRTGAMRRATSSTSSMMTPAPRKSPSVIASAADQKDSLLRRPSAQK